MRYTTARANFMTFSQPDQNFRTTLKFQDNFRTTLKFQELQKCQDNWDPYHHCQHRPMLIQAKKHISHSFEPDNFPHNNLYKHSAWPLSYQSWWTQMVKPRKISWTFEFCFLSSIDDNQCTAPSYRTNRRLTLRWIFNVWHIPIGWHLRRADHVSRPEECRPTVRTYIVQCRHGLSQDDIDCEACEEVILIFGHSRYTWIQNGLTSTKRWILNESSCWLLSKFAIKHSCMSSLVVSATHSYYYFIKEIEWIGKWLAPNQSWCSNLPTPKGWKASQPQECASAIQDMNPGYRCHR